MRLKVAQQAKKKRKKRGLKSFSRPNAALRRMNAANTGMNPPHRPQYCIVCARFLLKDFGHWADGVHCLPIEEAESDAPSFYRLLAALPARLR